MKASNAERFLTAYNNIDYGLRSIYGFKRSMSFSDVVRRSVVLNSVVRKYEDDLIDYGRLRNAIVHQGNHKFIIAEPHDEVVDEFEKIAKLIATPPTAFNKISHKEVVICDADISIKEVLQIMARTGYHNIPVYMNGVLQGVAIATKLIESIGMCLINGNDATEYLNKTKVIDVITKDDESNYYRVADTTMTIEKALNYFYINRRLSLILITEKGTHSEKPIGIITTADILDMNAVLENY